VLIGVVSIGLIFLGWFAFDVVQGPLDELAGGIDIGLVLSVLVAAVLYLGALAVRPEPTGRVRSGRPVAGTQRRHPGAADTAG
jgi:hypothetical protein